MGFKESTETRERYNLDIKYPDRFHVVVLNDDVTPMTFVVQMLVDVFNKNLEQAKDLTIAIHQQGKAIAGSYSHEIAEQKHLEAVGMARTQGFPLQLTIEKM